MLRSTIFVITRELGFAELVYDFDCRVVGVAAVPSPFVEVRRFNLYIALASRCEARSLSAPVTTALLFGEFPVLFVIRIGLVSVFDVAVVMSVEDVLVRFSHFGPPFCIREMQRAHLV